MGRWPRACLHFVCQMFGKSHVRLCPTQDTQNAASKEDPPSWCLMSAHTLLRFFSQIINSHRLVSLPADPRNSSIEQSPDRLQGCAGIVIMVSQFGNKRGCPYPEETCFRTSHNTIGTNGPETDWQTNTYGEGKVIALGSSCLWHQLHWALFLVSP